MFNGRIMLKHPLHNVDTLGSVDFANLIVTFDSLGISLSQRAKAVFEGRFIRPKNLHRTLTPQDYLDIEKVLPLAVHEYTHFFDSTSTLWGLRHLCLLNRSYESNFIFNSPEKDFHNAMIFFDHCRRIRFPEYYTVIDGASDESRPWRSSITLGYLFDKKGQPSVKPILFSRFSNARNLHLVRSPVSTVSILEASAMANEIIWHDEILSASETDFSIVQRRIVHEQLENYLYRKDITEYSVCAHIVANELMINDIVDVFKICCIINRTVLNFSEEACKKLSARCQIETIFGVRRQSSEYERIREGLKWGDPGILFYSIVLAFPKKSYATLEDIFIGLCDALEKLGIDYPTFRSARDKRADALSLEMTNSRFMSVRALAAAGRENMRVSDADFSIDFSSLHLPPAWLENCTQELIFDSDNNSLRDFSLEDCFEGKRRPNPVLTPQTLSLSRRSFTADKSKCPGSKSSPHHARMAWCSGWSGSRMASRKSA